MVCGCGRGKAVDRRAKITVAGKVTVKGQPINGVNVSLTFRPADNSMPVSIPLKADGSFSGDAIAGKNHVIVNASRTPEAGHSEGKSLGIGKLFLDNGSPLKLNAAGAAVALEVGETAAKDEGQQEAGTTGRRRRWPRQYSPWLTSCEIETVGILGYLLGLQACLF